MGLCASDPAFVEKAYPNDFKPVPKPQNDNQPKEQESAKVQNKYQPYAQPQPQSQSQSQESQMQQAQLQQAQLQQAQLQQAQLQQAQMQQAQMQQYPTTTYQPQSIMLSDVQFQPMQMQPVQMQPMQMQPVQMQPMQMQPMQMQPVQGYYPQGNYCQAMMAATFERSPSTYIVSPIPMAPPNVDNDLPSGYIADEDEKSPAYSLPIDGSIVHPHADSVTVVLDGIYNNLSELQRKEINEVFNKHDIASLTRHLFLATKQFEIYIIADNSGSMQIIGDEGISRYKEEQNAVETAVELVAPFTDNGVNIRFLNNYSYCGPYNNVKTAKQVKEMFAANRPDGGTPLSKSLREVLAIHTEKPKIVLIATDGAPSDSDYGFTSEQTFSNVVSKRNAKNNRICFMACTSNQNDVEYLSRIEKLAEYTDCLDDYASEKKEVFKVQGKNAHYTPGEHIARWFLAAIYDEYDKLDEKPLLFDSQHRLIIHKFA